MLGADYNKSPVTYYRTSRNNPTVVVFEIETIPRTLNVAEGSTIWLQCAVKHELDEAGNVTNGSSKASRELKGV